MNTKQLQNKLNQAITLHQSNQIDLAKPIYEEILSFHPNNFDALHLLGIALYQSQQFPDSLKLLNKAILINPKYVDAHFNRGIVLGEMKQYEEALNSYNKVILINPKHLYAHSNRGIVLRNIKRFQEAIESYDRAILLNPNYVDAYSNRGNVLRDMKRYEEALESYDKAIFLNPNYVDAHFNRGNVLRDMKRYEEALESYDRAIFLNPRHLNAHSNRGIVLRDMKRYKEALESHDRAIFINPNYINAHANRGNILRDMKRYEEALESYDRAILINPNYVNAHSNRGIVLRDMKRYEEALESYNRAILINPEYVDAKYNKSFMLLEKGEFDEGFQLYEHRWEHHQIPIRFNQAPWLGDKSIEGKTILIHSEQGLGDTIQFCRYLKMVSALGAYVIFEVEPVLFPLLKQLNGVNEFIQKGESLPEFDYHCPLLTLPLAFKTSLETIPCHNAYLKADIDKRKIWEKRLGNSLIPKIGLTWSGSSTHKDDHNRTIELSTLLQYLPSGFEYVSLQKELRDSDIQALNSSSIKFFGDQLNDFSDTAALCDLMDMVISVDTSIAHLSGALGKPTIVLLPFISDWRWLLDRDDSPWYPSMHLLRQKKDSDWDSCLSQLSKIIQKG